MNENVEQPTPIIKWRTNHGACIDRQVCTRESEHCVWFAWEPHRPVERHLKMTESAQYHDTWEAARDYLLNDAEQSVASRLRSLKIADAYLARIMALEAPLPDPEV